MPDSYTPSYYRVTAPSLRLRKEASTNSVLVIGLPKGRVVKRVSDFRKPAEINEVQGNWIEVEALTGHRGYVFDPYVESAKLSKMDWSSNYDRAIFNCPPSSAECLEQLEKELLKKESAVVEKKQDFLIIHNFDGSSKEFREIHSPEDSVTLYRPTAVFLNERYLIITVLYYEGGEFLLYDRKHSEYISLWDYPKLSPDGSTLLVTSMADAYLPRGIQVIRLGANAPVILEERKTEWYPCDASWSTANRISLHECHVDYQIRSENRMVKSTVDLRIKGNSVTIQR